MLPAPCVGAMDDLKTQAINKVIADTDFGTVSKAAADIAALSSVRITLPHSFIMCLLWRPCACRGTTESAWRVQVVESVKLAVAMAKGGSGTADMAGAAAGRVCNIMG